MFIKTGTAPGTLYYVHTDYLGSITALTNTTGSIAEQYAYDAWGRRRNPTDWSFTNVPAPTLLTRGFTGHEHIDELTLINMNGRVYDPVLGMFLSPDNFLQSPTQSQNFNRYSYALGNPLKFTDPDGNFFFIMAIGFALMQADIAGNASTVNGGNYWSGFGQSAAVSAVGMAVGFGVGSFVGGLLPSGTTPLGATLWGGASGALSGGITGGFMNISMGGNFKNGFVNGAIGGGIMGAISGYMNYESQMAAFREGCDEMGIEEGDPVPAKDDFLKQSQKGWYKDAPMDKITKFTTEHAPAFDSNDQYAKTTAEFNVSSQQLTGRSNVYFNKNSAFSSAKQLFFTMGHEFVHVSQIAALVGQPLSLWRNPDFKDMIEFHAYSYQNSIGGTRLSAFPPSVVRALATQFSNYFNAMSYTNFGWTTTANYKYPF